MPAPRTSGRRTLLALLTIAALAVLVVGVRSRSEKRLQAVPLVVEPSGCGAVIADGSCERPADGKVRVWVDANAVTRVRVAGRDVEASSAKAGDGARVALDVPSSHDDVRIEIEAGERRGALVVRSTKTPEWARRAAESKAKGDHAAVAAAVTPHLDDPEPALRARALGLLARAELAQGHTDVAAAHFRQSSKEALAAGRASDAVDDGLALSYMLSRAARWAEARAAIAEIEPLARAYPDGRARIPYYRSLASFAFGDIRRALRELDIARREADRLGLVRLSWNVRNERALALERWGRRDEAIVELRSLLSERTEGVAACDLATAAFNLGYATLVRSQEERGPCSGEAVASDSELWLAKANDPQCPDAARAAMGHVLLGDAALGKGDPDRASAELDRADLRNATLGLRRDHLDLRARIHLVRKEAKQALDAYERLVAIARTEGRVDDERRALEGEGAAYEALGRPSDALAAYDAADALLAAASVLVPLGEAGRFQSIRDSATRARVDLLIAAGRTREALDVARTARVRLLTGVASLERIDSLPEDARARWESATARYRTQRKKIDAESGRDWERAGAELENVRAERAEALRGLRSALDDALLELPRTTMAPLSPPETVDLALFVMTTRAGVLVFVGGRGAKEPRVERIGSGAMSSASAKEIAGVVATELAALPHGATVKVVASAELSCVDLHAEPAFANVRVVYALDLPAPPPKERPFHGLVVSDSRDDLPLARDEAKLVAPAFQREGPSTILMGRQTTFPAFHDALEVATTFHYAGHAFEVDGDIVLPLAGGARFGAADVLALRASPERVTLSACTAGRIAPSGVALGHGLVQAFIERGATEVLAPTRPVRDELALALARALVDEPRAPLSRLRASRPELDWSAYRIWGR